MPGLYSEAQFEGWKLTTKAVHDKGSRILVQLMHMGLVGRPANLPKGARVLGPTPIAAPGKMALPSSLTTQRSRE